MDGATRSTTLTIGNIYSVFSLVMLILALGFLGALVWLMLQ